MLSREDLDQVMAEIKDRITVSVTVSPGSEYGWKAIEVVLALDGIDISRSYDSIKTED